MAPSLSLFKQPEEAILSPVLESFPGRERQIRTLGTLLHPSAALCRTLTLHGVEATGKTSIAKGLLASLSSHVPALRHAIIHAGRCITARHLFESIVAAVAEALEDDDNDAHGASARCETLAQLDVELCRLLKYRQHDDDFRFVLVLDAIDRARDAPTTLMPALARMSEIIPCLTTVFIVTSPPPHYLHTTPSSPALHFTPYTKPELVRILSLSPPSPPAPPPTPFALDESSNSEASPAAITQADIDSLWPRFCAAVYDALVRPAARSLPAFRAACHALWPRFIAPLVLQQQQQQPNGASHPVYTAKDFSKLLVAARTHFQDETVLNPSIISARPSATLDRTTAPSSSSSSSASPTTTDLATLLPRTARVLLMCAYLASHNPARHDLALFSTHHRLTRKRRSHGHGRASSHRKIARKLLGAHAFVLERMLAIYAAVRGEWLDEDASRSTASLDGDVGTALATLSSLRLLNRVGAGADVMDRGAKWRINVGWEVVRGVGRSMGVEVEEWLME